MLTSLSYPQGVYTSGSSGAVGDARGCDGRPISGSGRGVL